MGDLVARSEASRVALEQMADDAEDFVELPKPPSGVVYDRSDRKFLAVAVAHAEHPPILQSFDSKWWGWRAALAQAGVTIHFLELESPSGQWKPLKRWLSTRRHALAAALTPGLILFGEWCYAVHSVRYTSLPDWFLGFDVYDRVKGEFWSVERRNELVRQLDVAVVPELGFGRFDLKRLKVLLGRSTLTDRPAEGLYVRREEGGRLLQRAKLVRPEFVQNLDAHWSKRRLEANQVVSTAR